MKIYIVDSFTKQLFFGNQAGVVLLKSSEPFPENIFMQDIAAELKHSETAFVKQIAPRIFQVKYFTPIGEVDLCGHATIALFTVLREENIIELGNYIVSTLAGNLQIQVLRDTIWMDMAEPKEKLSFNKEKSIELYEAYGLDISDMPTEFIPKIINTGLDDIILPVNDKRALGKVVQNVEHVSDISLKYNVVGIHIFCLSKDGEITAYCRNFAPLYGIIEEAATGTSNCALTYYLSKYGLIENKKENVFVQGEQMGKRSEIRTRLFTEDHKIKIQVGGSAVISMECRLRL